MAFRIDVSIQGLPANAQFGAEGADVSHLLLLLLGLGMAGFIGTYGASRLLRRHRYRLLAGLPLALGGTTLALLSAGHLLGPAAIGVNRLTGMNSAAISRATPIDIEPTAAPALLGKRGVVVIAVVATTVVFMGCRAGQISRATG